MSTRTCNDHECVGTTLPPGTESETAGESSDGSSGSATITIVVVVVVLVVALLVAVFAVRAYKRSRTPRVNANDVYACERRRSLTQYADNSHVISIDGYGGYGDTHASSHSTTRSNLPVAEPIGFGGATRSKKKKTQTCLHPSPRPMPPHL